MENLRDKLLNYFVKQPHAETTTSFSINLSKPLIPAGVLVPIIDAQSQLSVLFTLRSSTLKHHAGHVSFPGGRAEIGDPNLLATALRETQEETGLFANTITVLGELPTVISSSNYVVTPFVGLVKPPLQLILDTKEVAAAFTVPFNHLLNLKNYQKQFYTLSGGLKREFYRIEFGEYKIWGMTAAIMYDLSKKLCAQR